MQNQTFEGKSWVKGWKSFWSNLWRAILWGKTYSVTYFSKIVTLNLRKEKSPTFPSHCFHKCWEHNTHKPHSHAADQLPLPSFSFPKAINTSALDTASNISVVSSVRSHFWFKVKNGWCIWEFHNICGLPQRHDGGKTCGRGQAEADIRNKRHRSCGVMHSHTRENQRLNQPPTWLSALTLTSGVSS